MRVKRASALMIVSVVCLSMLSTSGLVRTAQSGKDDEPCLPYLHDDFQGWFTMYPPAPSSAAFYYKSSSHRSGVGATGGVSDNNALKDGKGDGKVLELDYPKDDPDGGGSGSGSDNVQWGPNIISNNYLAYGTYRARLKAAHCGSGEGLDSGFFIYWISDDGSGLSTEIDFEILGATTQLVYLSVWTKHLNEHEHDGFSKTTRLIYLRTGEVWQTPPGGEDAYALGQLRHEEWLTKTISDYDASTNYYTYGFTWDSDSVKFFIYDLSGSRIDLWQGPDSAHIPTHPARLQFNLWYAPNDFKFGDPMDRPTTDSNMRVDWVEYKPPGIIENGLSWLSFDQNPDRSWSYGDTENVGITSLAALAFLNDAILVHSDPDVWKALDWIVSQRASNGAISTPATGGREENGVYDTSMAILALVAGRSLGYAPSGGTNLDSVVNDAVSYLLRSQCVGVAADGYNYALDNPHYGGWGYPHSNWADLSNTQFAVLALAAADTSRISTVPTDVWKNAALFTIRCLEDSRYNPYWAGANDYGFEYRPWGLQGSAYESMTGAGVWCLGLCRAHVSSVTVDGATVPLDSAISDGVRWLQAHASVDENYGRGNYFYYYTLMSVAKGYVIVNQGLVWRALMTAKLIFSQAPDGRWASTYSEEPDTMATVEAILALETWMAPPSTISPELHVILGSYANLYITDPAGRHLGIDPNTGQVINEIPDATFSVNSEQTASIPYPQNGTYVVSIVGTGAGPYNLTVEGEINGTMTSLVSFLGNASRGVTQEWSATVAEIFGPFTVITTPRIHVGLPADVNGDGKVDLKDAFLVYKAFGSSPGSLNWNLLADLNEDAKVDLKDVFIVGKNFGKHT